MTEEKEKVTPPPLPILSPSCLLSPIDIQLQMNIRHGINNFYQTGANEIAYFIQFLIPEASCAPSAKPCLIPTAREKKKGQKKKKS